MGGMTRLLLLLWAGVTASAVVDLQKRVIGGQPCRQDQRQYHVKLILSKGQDAFLCGGSLISDQWILTAAHCWKSGGTMTAFLGRAPGRVQRVLITASPMIFEEKFIFSSNKIHDIMLLELPDGTPIPPQIQYVRLPDCRQRLKTRDRVQIAGYGATAAGHNGEKLDTTSNTLHCAETDIADTKKSRACLEKDDPVFYQSREHEHLIFGKRAGVDTSPGDSGGGVEYNDMIYGVHSFSGDYACDVEAGFMDVCEYMKWINETIDPPPVGCSWCG